MSPVFGALNRTLPEWFSAIRAGTLRLPRFQRFEEWSRGQIESLLDTVIRGLPAGAALLLQVGDEERFISRAMIGAPATPPNVRVTEHLLDGQQRLTALWRAFHDDYGDRTFFVWFDKDEEESGEMARVYGQGRWLRNGKLFPLWADDPRGIHERNYIPLRLLRPGEVAGEVGRWCDDATAGDIEESRALERRIQGLRERVITFNIPYLSLEATTPKDVALDVFIKMNTSYVRLSAFDILVAQIEAEAGESLHDLLTKLEGRVPAVRAYLDPEGLILDVASLRENRAPTLTSYNRLDVSRLVTEWSDVVEGVAWAIEFLEQERIFDGERLPTIPVIRLLAALHRWVPPALDERGAASRLLRKYIWRAFLTRRYDSSAATATLQDFRALRDVLQNNKSEGDVPIFREEDFPLPEAEELTRANWPRTKDTLGRAILAIAIKRGARDLADDSEARRENLLRREYHHLFPEALLVKDGGLEEREAHRALNCALITWNTNRAISAKEPLKYLRERVQGTGLAEELGLEEIKTRLASHVVPFDALNVGDYSGIGQETDRKERIQRDYQRFLESRAQLFLDPIRKLCEGDRWP